MQPAWFLAGQVLNIRSKTSKILSYLMVASVLMYSALYMFESVKANERREVKKKWRTHHTQ